jgi:hypothetical protein
MMHADRPNLRTAADERRTSAGRPDRAARRYLDELAAWSVTSQIDQALLAAGNDDSGAAAAAAGRGLLAAAGDDW